MSVVAELVFQRSLARGIALMRHRPEIVDAIFEQEAALFPTHIADFKDWLKANPEIPVEVNWPVTGSRVPSVYIVENNSVEEERYDFLGDVIGLEAIQTEESNLGGDIDCPTDPANDYLKTIAQAESLAIVQRTIFDIVVVTLNSVTTAMLTSAVDAMIQHGKLRLETVYDIKDLRLRQYDFRFPDNFKPTRVWAKSVQATCLVSRSINTWAFRGTEDEDIWDNVVPTIKRLDTSLTPQQVRISTDFNLNEDD